VKKIIFSSSSEIYSNSYKIPYSEKDEPEPFSLYGKCKKEIEIFLRHLSESNADTQIMIPRFFNVYGPSQRKDFVVNNFIKRALTNGDIEIFGDGNQTRSFTYVDDVVRALRVMLDYNDSKYEIFNIGSRYECSIKELAQAVLSLTPESTSKIVFKDYGINGIRSKDLEILRRVPSTEKSKSMLGFEAVVSPEEGIKAIIKNAK